MVGGVFGRADDVGGFAAFGGGDEEIAGGEPEIGEHPGAPFGVVFEGLDGADERGVAPGHDADDLRGVEGGAEDALAGEYFE